MTARRTWGLEGWADEQAEKVSIQEYKLLRHLALVAEEQHHPSHGLVTSIGELASRFHTSRQAIWRRLDALEAARLIGVPDDVQIFLYPHGDEP